MEKFNFSQIPVETNEEESLYEGRLENLWEEYGFPGKPPRKGTEAENRLLEKCRMHSSILVAGHARSVQHKNLTERTISDSDQRKLHNEIAVMVMGKKRSGMDESTARAIANFAFEYARGLTFKDFIEFKTDKFDMR
ncbi:MAG: hypothetical protein NTV02_00625 [Candidatus Zambryskibacteria bacterium]|nr:hypothetical protein [Candidatus Zambryskibacteria bacterium]